MNWAHAVLLISALPVASAAAAEAPLKEAEQLQILEKIGEALAGGARSDSLKTHFRKDAVFVGVEEYPWDLDGFRRALKSRDCATRPRTALTAEAVLIGVPEAERRLAREAPSYGPGLTFYCVSATRVAAHEVYSFRFRGSKIASVHFARMMVVPNSPSTAAPAVK